MLSSLKAYEITKIGQNRGSPRLWLQGLRAQLAGFLPGKRFNVRKDESRSMLILELDETGIRLVSKKSRASGDVPVIDVNSKELLSVFEGLDSVRVIVQSKRIVVLPLQADLAQRERLGRLIAKLHSNEPLKLGSVAHGGGVLSHELHAEEWNVLEHRVRLCVVAVTRGLKFDFSMLRRPGRQVRTIAEILDPIGPDDPRWSRMQGLKEKETRDAAAGKCFKMQLVSSDDTMCPTITKGYSKVRSTDPKLRHPTNPDLLRQFTSAEHARLKGVSPELVFGLSETIAHEVLGQSICYEPFRAVANSIGHMLKSMGKAMSPTPVAIA